MKKILAITSLVFLVSTVSYAQQAGLGWAAGYDQNIGGISLRYLPGTWGIDVAVGATVTLPEDDNLDTGFDLNLGANLIFPLYTGFHARLNGLAGVWAFSTSPTDPAIDTATNIWLVLGVEPELFVVDNLSLSTKMGVRATFGDQFDEDTGAIIEDTFIGTFGPQFDLFQGISIRYYFQ